MKIAPPQAVLPTLDRNLAGLPRESGQPQTLSFDACFESARERREQRPSQAFEFTELGVFGVDRDSPTTGASGLATASPHDPETVGHPAASPPEPSPSRPQRHADPPNARVAMVSWPEPAPSPEGIETLAAGRGVAQAPSARLPSRAPSSMNLGDAEAALAPVGATASNRRAPLTLPQEPTAPASGARARPQRAPEQKGAIRVSIHQAENGLVVQAFATGGVTADVVTRLRQRAQDLALEHGQTLADLTINGAPIGVVSSRRTQ